MTSRTLAHYLILEKIGAGGMGEVYRAHDQKLERDVAIKLLPASSFTDSTAKLRLLREAQAAAALNHAHICTIHEVGETDSQPYIVMELVEGESLSSRLASGPLPTVQILRYSIQLADALGHAHERGVVHRDLKAANVIVTPDGRLKILDFGLARRLISDDIAEVMISTLTQQGAIAGTLAYMAPEQLRGRTADARSDIWALGVLLYEMATGVRPFRGQTGFELSSAIQNDSPQPLPSKVPEEFQVVIHRCLEKEPGSRYQRAGELRAALEAIESGAAKLRRGRRQMWVPAFGATIALIAVLGAVAFMRILELRSRTVARSFEKMKITRLISDARVLQAAVSPDGEYVSYVVEAGNMQSVWMRQIVTGAGREIVPAMPARISLRFSPDGDYLYFVRRDKASTSGPLYQVPVLGGGLHKVTSNIGWDFDFSPAGLEIAFTRPAASADSRELVITDLEGAKVRVVARWPAGGWLRLPTWSPDGLLISCLAWDTERHLPLMHTLRLSDGHVALLPLRNLSLGIEGKAVWLSDSRGWILSSPAQDSSIFQLWEVRYPSGTQRRITNDLQDYIDLSLTADSRQLVAIQQFRHANVFLLPAQPPGEIRQVTQTPPNYFVSGLQWTADRRLVYAARPTGGVNVWIMNADGTAQQQLTRGQISGMPAVSPDGNTIVFMSTEGGGAHIWRMDFDGGNRRRLTSGDGDYYPTFAPDGRSVIYANADRGVPFLFRIPAQGGRRVALSDTPLWKPRVSPDGKLIAALSVNRERVPTGIAVLPAAGGEPLERWEVQADAVCWSPDSRSVTYSSTDGHSASIWKLPLADGRAELIARVHGSTVSDLAWSPDGRELAFIHGVKSREVVMLTDFLPDVGRRR